ncbi:MAG: tetratricopeptide repeat protein [Candidatus Electrothrix sp. Rat3]|nr:tetratricopeptide repeat protein [Candidatus Electrothrix rattekaaiensis]
MGTTDNSFNNSGDGEQNIGQGDGAIGKQENINQDVRGNRNIVLGTGDAYVEEHHHHYPRTPQGIPLQRPRQPDHLVGRDELLREVLTKLQPGKAVTLCGPGGIGKTALASRAAWELSPDGRPPVCFPDGLIFYSFYGRKDAGLAFDHLMRSYVDDSQDNGPEAVRQLLAGKQALIILDGAEEADDLPAVLRCCGGCGVLITSRKRSDAPGSLLEVKRLDELPAAEAFRLYSNTAADETTVHAVCEQLGGWPLALRIAGHYLRSTGESAADYLRFLAKVPFQRLGRGEHQDENAALLLRRSMEQVSEDAHLALTMAGSLAFAPLGREPLMALLDRDELHSCDTLNELALYGLLERKGERWQVSHALIHTYARTELVLNKESMERLAWYYIACCDELSEAGLPGYAHLDAQRAHCIRLMESCLASELWQEVKALAKAIDNYLYRQGYWAELLAVNEMRLTAARQAEDRQDEAWSLNALGCICWWRGDDDKQLSWFKQGMSIARELGDKEMEWTALNNIGVSYQQQGKYVQALQCFQQTLTIYRDGGDRKGECRTLSYIGMLYYAQEDYEQAMQYYQQCLRIAREVSYKISEGLILYKIAMIYRVQSKPSKALEYGKQALAIVRELGDRRLEVEDSWNLGLTYEDMGDLAQAEKHIALAVEIAEQIGHSDLEEYRDGLTRVRAKRQGAKEA